MEDDIIVLIWDSFPRKNHVFCRRNIHFCSVKQQIDSIQTYRNIDEEYGAFFVHKVVNLSDILL